jgi:hypothetical protein
MQLVKTRQSASDIGVQTLLSHGYAPSMHVSPLVLLQMPCADLPWQVTTKAYDVFAPLESYVAPVNAIVPRGQSVTCKPSLRPVMDGQRSAPGCEAHETAPQAIAEHPMSALENERRRPLTTPPALTSALLPVKVIPGTLGRGHLFKSARLSARLARRPSELPDRRGGLLIRARSAVHARVR